MKTNGIKRWHKITIAAVGGLLLVWLISWLVGLDSAACEQLGGHLIFKSAGKNVVEFCVSDDGRILR